MRTSGRGTGLAHCLDHMGCYLRVSGRQFDVDGYVRRGSLPAATIYRRGEPEFKSKPKGRKALRSGINVLVSRKHQSDFAGQLKDAVRFLERHMRAIQALRRRPGVQDGVLDFGVEPHPEAAMQMNTFSVHLVRLAGQAGLALELSTWLTDWEHLGGQQSRILRR